MNSGMHIIVPSWWRRLLFWVLVFLLAGCMPGNSPPTQFYLLEPDASHELLIPQASKQVIVLTPVRIAHYLDRPQIVTALERNRYQVSEFNRWAENLDDNIHRVLQQDLARLLPADVSSQINSDALQVSVTILAFHVDAQGQARLTAQWQFSKNKQLLKMGQGEYREWTLAADYPARVAAMNVCLARMTRQLVSDIQALSR